VAVECLQQFDALLLADRQRVDHRMGIDGQLELVGQAADVGRRLRGRAPGRAGSAPSTMFSATVIGPTSMKC
jgi:hypothetical protein